MLAVIIAIGFPRSGRSAVIRDTICGAEPGPMMASAVEAGMHEC